MSPRVGVVLFPGSNCEQDVVEAIESLGGEAGVIWHGATELGDVDAIVLPGGFAYGDYLRPGAIARFSPVMGPVADFARAGGPVIGICNGFQVLTEAGLLPGALQKNAGLKFLCRSVTVRVESTRSALTNQAEVGQKLTIPINHFEGNYTCDERTIAELRDDDRILFTYVDNPVTWQVFVRLLSATVLRSLKMHRMPLAANTGASRSATAATVISQCSAFTRSRSSRPAKVGWQ